MGEKITINKAVYRVVLIALLILSIFILIRLSPTLVKSENVPGDDFVRFWASGKLNLQGKDPYDPQVIEKFQIELGDLVSGQTSLTLNPPWAVSLLMPFGYLDYPISRLSWMLVSILLIMVSSLVLWRIDSGEPKKRWLAILVAFTFAPTISVLEKGQLTPLLLLGIVGFLYFSIFQRNDWLGGASLALLTVKPQVVLLLAIPLLLWIIHQRRWIILLAPILTLIFLTLIGMIANPSLIQQYIGMLHTYHFSEWANPTIGSYLRFFWLGVDRFWVQFLPVVLGGIWVIFYWIKHRASWNWVEEMPIILFIAILTSPYAWTYDLVILVPAIILAAVWISADWKNWFSALMIGIYLLINILDLVLHMRLDEFWFIWLAPALFIWFLVVKWKYHIAVHKALPSPELQVTNG